VGRIHVAREREKEKECWRAERPPPRFIDAIFLSLSLSLALSLIFPQESGSEESKTHSARERRTPKHRSREAACSSFEN